MKKKVILTSMLGIILAFGFVVAGCNKNALVGTWVDDTYGDQYIFNNNGNFEYILPEEPEAFRGTYTRDGENITMTVMSDDEVILVTTGVISGNKLTTSDELNGKILTSTYTKKQEKSSKNKGITDAAEPEDTTLETYPSDYRIAYFNLIGITPVPTVRDLFGPNAKFLTSFDGVPAVVTLEKISGTADEFSGQILLTKGDEKAMRMLVTFESDNMSEMSYCRYIKFVNLSNGRTAEKRSYGDQGSDAELLGMLVSSMKYFWDTSKE